MAALTGPVKRARPASPLRVHWAAMRAAEIPADRRTSLVVLGLGVLVAAGSFAYLF